MDKSDKKSTPEIQEKILRAPNGLLCLFVNLALMALSVYGIVICLIRPYIFARVFFIIISMLYLFIVGPIMFGGVKVLKPNEAYVFTLFGRYYGTLVGPGIFLVNPFVSAMRPRTSTDGASAVVTETETSGGKTTTTVLPPKKISLKVMTLNNNKQKINDLLGNPIEIGVVVIWKVKNTAQALFNVDDYFEYLSIQADTSIRNIARLYPYDVVNDDDASNDSETSLRGSSAEVAERLAEELQSKVEIAGIEIIEARITHLAYATEIAAAMLQRQQASAIIAARKLIVEGAVGMVEMALAQLSENDIVTLDEERKAAMVSNLLVVLCGNKDAQPIVNSGSIY